MTLITDALDRIARQVSLSAPSSWLTATEVEYVEIRDDFMMETIGDILDRVDLPSPIGGLYEITGDGGGDYALPADFRRLARDRAAVYEPSYRRIVHPIPSDGLWRHLEAVGSTGAERYYKVSGYDGNYTISFFALPDAGNVIAVSYVSQNWRVAPGGAIGSTFRNPTDELLLPRELVEAGTVWRWRERKGLPYQDKMMEYEANLARLANDGRTRRTISINGIEPVRPWDVPVPNYIPD